MILLRLALSRQVSNQTGPLGEYYSQYDPLQRSVNTPSQVTGIILF